jgi:hypothetical protein
MDFNTLLGRINALVTAAGSPMWYILGAVTGTILLARWYSAIRRLLPLIGSMTLIGLALWIVTYLGLITWHLDKY